METMDELIDDWAGRLRALAPHVSDQDSRSYVYDLVQAAQRAQDEETAEAAFEREE
ncbi:hypothetical protein [Kitasatospora cineracea]|uniref:hypothetical protein n=1 Tax=Kitasatospora cineracea TaxID=88074 RepID=UPI00378BC5A4